jgi:hypothetical protein
MLRTNRCSTMRTTGYFFLAIANLASCNRVLGADGVFTLSTGDSEFRTGSKNQGWWGSTLARASDNDNPFVGTFNWSSGGGGSSVMCDYFTFDLRSLPPDVVVTAATLRIERGGSLSPTSISFYDVSTDVGYLNTGTGPDEAVWNDLGSGMIYGDFNIATIGTPDDILEFPLDSLAIEDINRTGSGFFSVGGRMDSVNGYVFAGFSSPGTHELVLSTRPLPEPRTTLLLCGLWMFTARRFRSVSHTGRTGYPRPQRRLMSPVA